MVFEEECRILSEGNCPSSPPSPKIVQIQLIEKAQVWQIPTAQNKNHIL